MAIFGVIEEEILAIVEKALQEHPELNSDELEIATKEAIQSALSSLFELMPNALEDTSTKTIRTLRKQRLGFEKRCYRRWRRAFELYEIIRGVATEIGEKHAQEQFEASEDEHDYIFGALSYLHPRMLLVAGEIDALLRTGFPDGALARWRTLHEISVVAMFIEQSDQATAKRYLASFQFNALRAANQLNKYADRAKLNPFSTEEIAEMESHCVALTEDLGRQIKGDYDWAKEAVGKNRPTLLDLEEASGLDHWRPRYRWASQHTHAGHRPLDKLLGMAEAKEPINLVGASNSGFVDPFSMSGISISICCAAFLGRRPTIDSIVALKSIEVLSQKLEEIALQLEKETLERHEQQNTFKARVRRIFQWIEQLLS